MITDKNTILQDTHPHYTDSRFRTEQTIFGQEEKGLQYEYSDRIADQDREAKKNSEVFADSKAVKCTAAWYEAYLSAHFDKPADIRHIIAGVNRSNGYPYRIYGFTIKQTGA